MRRAIPLILALAFVAGCNAFCNRRVFEQVVPTCDQTIANDVDIPAEKAADILIVVDNSASMQEEQTRLAQAFLNESGSCPIGKNDLKDFARCKDADPPAVCDFANPTPEQLAGELSSCGFIQVLAAFENDFRIGVITTDVGLCDNRVAASQAGLFCAAGQPGAGQPECGTFDGIAWGRRPQHGCLQPNGPPGTALKVIARGDLDDADTTNDEIGQRFIDTLNNIRIFGSATERGLDAAVDFLDTSAARSAGCEDDLNQFLRPDAKLIVIFLTDEEDCSRRDDVGAFPGIGAACDDPNGCDVFPCADGDTCVPGRSELTDEVCGEFGDHFFSYPARSCYEHVDFLSPVQKYSSFLKTLKPNAADVSVAVIAGGVPPADGAAVEAAGCIFDPANAQVPVGGCFQSGGNSNNTGGRENCSEDPVDPATRLARGCDGAAGASCDIPCCFADPGSRYFALADEMNGLKDTICVDSFGQTMIKIAVFIADVDFVKLAEKPANPSLIFVEKAPAGGDEFATIGRINDVVCGTGNGWVLEEDGLTVRFCGNARPSAGERVRVRAKGEGADGAGADACEGRGTAAAGAE